MLELYDQIESAAAFIRERWSDTPHAGVILGTGLGDFASRIETAATIDYGDIPNFPRSTVVSHRGRLIWDRRYSHNYDSIYGDSSRLATTLRSHDRAGPYNYFNAWWHPYYRRGDLHTLQSVTKTITSIIIGAAVGEIDALPGISRRTAEALVAARERRGTPFRIPSELLEVPGIKAKRLSKILPFLAPFADNN